MQGMPASIKLCGSQGNLTPVLAIRSNPPRLGPRAPTISTFDPAKLLHQPRDDVGCFRAHELLRRTRPRSAAERDEIPQRSETRPTLRTKGIGVRTPEIFVVMQTVDIKGYIVAFADEDGRFTVWATAGGEDGIVKRNAGVVV